MSKRKPEEEATDDISPTKLRKLAETIKRKFIMLPSIEEEEGGGDNTDVKRQKLDINENESIAPGGEPMQGSGESSVVTDEQVAGPSSRPDFGTYQEPEQGHSDRASATESPSTTPVSSPNPHSPSSDYSNSYDLTELAEEFEDTLFFMNPPKRPHVPLPEELEFLLHSEDEEGYRFDPLNRSTAQLPKWSLSPLTSFKDTEFSAHGKLDIDENKSIAPGGEPMRGSGESSVVTDEQVAGPFRPDFGTYQEPGHGHSNRESATKSPSTTPVSSPNPHSPNSDYSNSYDLTELAEEFEDALFFMNRPKRPHVPLPEELEFLLHSEDEEGYRVSQNATGSGQNLRYSTDEPCCPQSAPSQQRQEPENSGNRLMMQKEEKERTEAEEEDK